MKVQTAIHHHQGECSNAMREVYFQGVASLCFKYLKTPAKRQYVGC
jgi:hypothetical protein